MEQQQELFKTQINTQENKDDLITDALARAQGEIDQIFKDSKAKVETRSGGTYEFRYASLAAITEAIRKPMANNGLSLVFKMSEMSETERTYIDATKTERKIVAYTSKLTAHLLYKNQSIEVSMPIFWSEKTMQSLGSAITYAKRYLIQMLFNLAADEDDDGNASAGNKATITYRS